MASTKTKCAIKKCEKLSRRALGQTSRSPFCTSHSHKVTIGLFLRKLYYNMKRRVEGNAPHNRGNWAGKPILSRDVFMSWAKNHPTFLHLYKQYVMTDFNRKLAPSINRINSSKGYLLDNIEWVTNSQNSGLASTVRKLKAKKEVYNLLGVTTDV